MIGSRVIRRHGIAAIGAVIAMVLGGQHGALASPLGTASPLAPTAEGVAATYPSEGTAITPTQTSSLLVPVVSTGRVLVAAIPGGATLDVAVELAPEMGTIHTFAYKMAIYGVDAAGQRVVSAISGDTLTPNAQSVSKQWSLTGFTAAQVQGHNVVQWVGSVNGFIQTNTDNLATTALTFQMIPTSDLAPAIN
jgi:hypothetical protein